MNNQYPNSGQQPPLKTVVYAQRNPGEQPFAATMDLHPYSGQPNEQFQAVRLVQPPAMPTFGPTNPIGQPQQPNYGAWSNNPPPAPYGHPNLRPLAEQLNPRHEAVRVIVNGFTPCMKFLSALVMLFNTSMTVAIFVMVILFMTVSASHDYFNVTGIITKSFIIAFGLGQIFLRLFFVPWFGCRMPLTRNEKITLGFNLFFPQLKFHVFRLNPNFGGRLTFFYKQEIVMAIYELILAICAAVCFSNSFIEDSYNNRRDAIPLLLSIFCFIDVALCFPMFLCIHGQWIKYRCQQEKGQRGLGDPLLQAQPQPPMMPPMMPPANQNGQGQYQPFMGEPVYPDQEPQYPPHAADNAYPPVGRPVQPSPVTRADPGAQYRGVQYPDF